RRKKLTNLADNFPLFSLSLVTDVELKRLKDAFKRTSGLTYYMTQQCFYREVLGDGVPHKVAEVIYTSFGGSSKGLHFNNLIVGLVLLTRGRDEEKAKYLFSLFASDLGGYAAREDIEAVLQVLDGEVPTSLKKCFSEGDKVNYERFRNWLLQNKEAFTLSRWLLSGGVCVTLTDDSDTPTFYQTLAGVTHLEESDIIDLEKRYWLLKAQSRTGRFDLETFVPLVSPPIHASLSEGLFHAFDENRDNHIDFKEISCGLSACCRGPVAERQKFCFKVFDVDRDGVLSRDELHEMVVALLEVWKDNRTDTLPELHSSVSDIVEDILKMHDTTKLGHLTLEDYQIWSVKSALANEFLNLLFQVCHIVLGLRPGTPQEEGQIIRCMSDLFNCHVIVYSFEEYATEETTVLDLDVSKFHEMSSDERYERLVMHWQSSGGCSAGLMEDEVPSLEDNSISCSRLKVSSHALVSAIFFLHHFGRNCE
ncbi:ubiquitin carboxyl-terminal hydrolase 32-like, partial [Larimichthys crocea]|uniref:ubiquitin carboxyl-terminal hydrolase 32-like n=1 Tax=Larimichthys crocea TaxID=215358 RepID=UPI000F5D6A74